MGVQWATLKVAVIADIHGNVQALEAVLADIREQRIDEVIVNGDLVNRGPSNVEVMERVTSEGLPITLGNHDDLMRKWVDRDADIPEAWFEDPFWAGTAWAARELQKAGWIDTFRTLPMTYAVTPGGRPSLLLSHGSPRHYREGYGKFLTDADIESIIQATPADVLIGSHTHSPLERRWGRYLVLNTGAVGTPFNGDPRAQYLVMHLQNGAWAHEFRAVPYDRAGALSAFETKGLLEQGDLSARIFYEELLCARSFLTPFLMWTEKQDAPQNEETWARFKKAFADRFCEEASL